MTFLPIIARELRVASRRGTTYWGRAGVAALMICVAAWVFVMMHQQDTNSQAVAMFGALTGGMGLVSVLSGIRTTADCISQEKREGTLGLLFLTPLQGYDVVLGKLVSGSVNTFYGIVGVLPVLAIPILMGGISMGQFLRMGLVLLNTIYFSLSVGVFVSSLSRDEKRARSATLGWLFLLTAGFPIVGALIEAQWHVRGAAQWFMLFSPGYAYVRAWDQMQTMPWLGYWVSMATIFCVSCLFLFLSCWLTPRTWQDRRTRNRRVKSGERASDGTRVRESLSARFRHRALNRNAFYWLAARPWARPMLIWAVLIAVTLLWLGFGWKYPREMFDPSMFVLVALTWNGLLKVWFASETTRTIAVDRKSGSIELLLSTPITVRDVVRGQWLALVRQFGPVVVTVLAAELLLMLLGLREVRGGNDRGTWMLSWLACLMGMLLADLLALFVVGLWQAAVAKGPAEAAGRTVFRILALPWILFLLLAAFMAVVDSLGLIRRLPIPDEYFWFGSWAVIGFAVDLVLGVAAWRKIHSRFREEVTQIRLRGGWWAKAGRLVGRFRHSFSVGTTQLV